MFSKSSKKFQCAHIDTPFFNPISLIENYASRMVKLFALRGDAGKRLNKLIQERQGKVGIFGAGRVLDYFVKYCNLNVKNKNLILIDNFLINGTDNLYGKKLYRFNEVEHSNISFWIVFSNTSTSNISNLIRTRSSAPIHHSLDFFEIGN